MKRIVLGAVLLVLLTSAWEAMRPIGRTTTGGGPTPTDYTNDVPTNEGSQAGEGDLSSPDGDIHSPEEAKSSRTSEPSTADEAHSQMSAESSVSGTSTTIRASSTSTAGPDPTTTTESPTSDQTSESDTQEPTVSLGEVVLSDEVGFVLKDMAISNPGGPCLRIDHSKDIVVRNVDIGPCGGHAVVIEGSESISIQSNSISEAATGVYALNSREIVVSGNTFTNSGRNFVQFDKVTGPGNRIVGNRGANELGQSDAEDLVSIYKSSGTPESPIEIVDNHFANGGPSESGAGIVVGDQGGSNIFVHQNILANPGQAGIGVAGGSAIVISQNVVTSETHPWSNVGIYVWWQGGGQDCHSIEVRDNEVDWVNSTGSPNPAWNAGNCGTVAGWGSNSWGS